MLGGPFVEGAFVGLANPVIGGWHAGTEPGEPLDRRPEPLHHEAIEPGVADALVPVDEQEFAEWGCGCIVLEDANDESVVKRRPLREAVDYLAIPWPLEGFVVIAQKSNAAAFFEKGLLQFQGGLVAIDHPDQQAFPEFFDVPEEEQAEFQRVVVAERGMIDLAALAEVVGPIAGATVKIGENDQPQVRERGLLDRGRAPGPLEALKDIVAILGSAAPHEYSSASRTWQESQLFVEVGFSFTVWNPAANRVDEMNGTMNARTLLVFALATTLAALFSLPPAAADPGKPEGSKPPGREGGASKGRGRTVDPLVNLSSEERERFREAMRQAWSDPAVLQARDEVKEATEAYQEALVEAIKRNDPEVMAMMKKIRAAPDSPIKSLFSGGGPGGRRPGGGSGGFRDFEAFITGESPGFLKNLTEEQQKIYAQARERALESANFRTVVGKLRQLRKSDEAMRKERIEMFKRVRKTLHSEMIKADERVEAILPREGMRPMPPGAGPPRGPGKGPGRKRPEGEPAEKSGPPPE